MVIKSSPLSEQSSVGQALPQNYDWKSVESRVREFSAAIGIREQIRAKYGDRKRIGYVEGPPTLNGVPHIGHIRGRIMKDLWYRSSTIMGRNIVFRAGWDTQGLPVELQAEKELGLSGNKWEDLKKIGEEKLVEASKRLIGKYEKAWVDSDNMLGLLIDHGKAYMTYKNEYIEREWKYLEKGWQRGILGEGYKVVPYCPSCMTSLSHAEAVLGYETVEDPSLYYKVRTEDGSYLVIWTTMPFTVVTDELVGVKPGDEYAYVKVGDETWVVAAQRKEALSAELGIEFGETVKTVKGSDLAGARYEHPLLDLIPGLQKLQLQGSIHKVVDEEFVDTATGTGLVHLSPANGEEDFQAAMRRGVPIFAPIDDRVQFTEEAGQFQGIFVRDADKEVTRLLSERKSLVFEGRLEHEYPTCWRSGHRLVWVARREYFYWIDKIKSDLVEAAENVEYYFEQPRNRFLEFIRQSPPWCISRERVWGTPLPIWACGNCKEKVPAFSRREILELATELPDGPDFELHRPWIDRVVLKCPKCGAKAYREPFVLDTWHNSGSAPYASFTDEEYQELVPVAHLTEGIDQTRGWAYTLLVLNTIFSGRPLAPYRAFLFMGLVLDEKGRKMSKSLGNVIDALEMLRNGSVDLLRFYLMWKSAPVDTLSLDLTEMTGRPYQVLNTLYHLHVYLHQNGELDGYDPEVHTLDWARGRKILGAVDRWALSKLEMVRVAVLAAYAEGRYNEASKLLEQMVVETLSQNYVRMVRNELWKDTPEEKDRRLAIYSVMGSTLESLDVLLHPVSPFLTELLFQEVFAKPKWTESILLRSPMDLEIVSSKEDMETVEAVLEVESACNSARVKAKMKRRWPARRLIVLADADGAARLERGKELLSLLCNVKEVSFESSVASAPITLTLRPIRSQVGAEFKEKTATIIQKVGSIEGDEAWNYYKSGKPITVDLPDGKVSVPLGAFELNLRGAGDWEAGVRGKTLVVLDKVRDEALIAEGLVRDLARRLQALRKNRGRNPTEMLDSARVAGLDEEMLRLVEPLKADLAFLVRARAVETLGEKTSDGSWEEEELDGRPLYLDIS